MFQIAICDDQLDECNVLRDAIADYSAACGMDCSVTNYGDGKSMIFELEDGIRYDLVFMDIFMDGMSGMEAAHQIRGYDREIQIVFLTVSPDYALESYEVQAFDYLVKPFTAERLQVTMDRFRGIYEENEKESIIVSDRGRLIRIALKNIVFMESQHNNLFIYCNDGQVIKTRTRIADVEKELFRRDNFMKTHKSYIINMDFVKSVDDEFRMDGGFRVPMRVRERRNIKKQYSSYISGKQAGGKI